MKTLETIKVNLKYGKGGEAIINKCDFDEEKHELYEEKATEEQALLLGSNIQPSVFIMKDETEVQLGEIVQRAFEKSGLSVEKWNEMAELDSDKQEALIQDEVDLLDLPEASEEKEPTEEVAKKTTKKK